MPSRRCLIPFLALVLATPPLEAQNVAARAKNRLVLLDAAGRVAWEMATEGGQEIARRPNGNLVVRIGDSEIVEIEPTGDTVVWRHRPDEGQRITSFAPLANGNLLLSLASPPRLVEIDRLHREMRSIELEDPARIADVAENGAILVIAADGALLRLDAASGEADLRYRTDFHSCTAATSLADGRVAVGVGADVHLLDAEGDVIRKLRFPFDPAVGGTTSGHFETIASLTAWDGFPELFVVTSGAASADDQAFCLTLEGSRLASPELPAVTEEVEALRILVDPRDAERLERAREIHRRVITLDTHKDIRSSLASDPPTDSDDPERARLRDDPTLWGSNQVDFPKMRAGGLDVAFYIVYVGQGSLDEEGFARARAQALAKFDAIERMCERYPDDIALARTPDDVERIAAAGKLVCCIGIENGYAMGTDLGAIAEFHARGARYMSLTHNRHSQLGDSNTPADETLHGGLSDLGRQAIAEMNRVGIMVDVSHASKATTLQAIAASKAPVIASHSGVDAIREHGRNLSDDELRALKENGGVIQCVAFASYVKDDGGRRDFIRRTREELGLPSQRGSRQVADDPEVREKMLELRRRVQEFDAEREPADVADFVDHIDHAVKVAGIDHVAISSDFDGGGGISGWNDASETFRVTLELVRRGYSEGQIAKLWSGNTLRVWRAVEEVAQELSEGD